MRRSAFMIVPFIAWGGGIAGVLWLADKQARPLDYPGLAAISRHVAVAPSQGILQTLVVGRGSKVTAGQLIGLIDGSHLELRAKKVKNRIKEIRAGIVRERAILDLEVVRERERLEHDQISQMRRFQRDVENAKLNSLEVLASLAESRIKLEGLRIDLERQKGLSSQDLFSEAELIRTRTRFDALGERIKRTESILKSRDEKLVAVESRYSAYQKSREIKGADVDKMFGAFQFRVAAQNDELEMIALEGTRLELRAPTNGLVTAVHVEIGQLVSQGRPVVTIVDTQPGGMIAYVPPGAVKHIKAGMSAVLERSTNPGKTIRTKVLSVGPTVEKIPQQLLMIPTIPEWGVPVYLEFTPEMASMPGEAVRVRVFPDNFEG
jgi:HlyD family secretion protein